MPLTVATLGGGDADFDARLQCELRGFLALLFWKLLFIANVCALALHFAHQAVLAFNEYPTVGARRSRPCHQNTTERAGSSGEQSQAQGPDQDDSEGQPIHLEHW